MLIFSLLINSTLSWQKSDYWGVSCGSTSKVYQLFVSKDPLGRSSTSIAVVLGTSYQYTVSQVGNYSWWIRTFNGRKC